jgi:acetolactate synthase-1/2/3 large subunit
VNPALGRWRGADALVAALRRAGTTPVFTLSGNHIMPVFDAAIDSSLQLIHTRHEAAAVHMADAYARITGQVGVALVTGGPGHANAVSALYTAAMAEAPVLLLSGHAPHDQLGRGAFQEMRQAEMAAPVCKAAWVCSSADGVGADIARAMQIARSGRPGPVHLSLPTNVLEGICTAPTPDALAYLPQAQPLNADVAATVMQALLAARRPLILVGPASMTRPGRAALATLEAACGVPVVGMESPRGVADASLGAFAQVLAQADLVLLLGKRLDFTLKFGQAPFPAQAAVLQIDADAAQIDRARQALGARLQLSAMADAALAVQALTAVAHSHAAIAWHAEVRRAVAWRPPAWDRARSSLPGRLHPVQMLRPLQALLDSHPDAVLVCDGGEIGQWAMACLSAPHRLNNGVAGAIGVGLPYALAARVALPTAPVVAVMGDGSVGFHIAEFDTAVRHSLGLVAVVGNDARWNAEHQIQLRDYGPQRLIACELNATRYDAVAAAFGAWGGHVIEATDMASTAQAALDSGRPACVNVMIEGLAAPVIQR